MSKSKPGQQLKAESPHAVLEQTGTAFDPSVQYLDLSKEEKRRTTALLMAIQAYDNLIIKDAEMYIAISREQGKNEAPRISPGTIEGVVDAAIIFDEFISGRLQTIETTDPIPEPPLTSATAEASDSKSPQSGQ